MSYQPGDRATGVVVDVKRFGVFLALEDDTEGFIDGAGMSEPWLPIPDPETWPRVGETVTGRVLSCREHQTRLSIRPSDLRALSDGE